MTNERQWQSGDTDLRDASVRAVIALVLGLFVINGLVMLTLILVLANVAPNAIIYVMSMLGLVLDLVLAFFLIRRLPAAANSGFRVGMTVVASFFALGNLVVGLLSWQLLAQ